jgi:hypothetical protein
MSDATLDFLHPLFAACSPGYLTLTAIHPAGQHSTPSRHILLHNETALRTALADLRQANEMGWGAFFGVATRRQNLGRWRRGGQADLLALPALFVDVDAPLNEALLRVRAHDPPPSVLVSSGGGLHAYWLLDEPTPDWKQAKQALTHLQQQLDGDHASLAQSLRLPGSLNTKPQRDHALCQLLELHTARYPLAAFLPATTISANRHARRPVPIAHARTQPASFADKARLIAEIEVVLLRDYGGRWQSNGWLAALCPAGHAHDAPGKHFAFNPQRGVGVCLGRHGRMVLVELCQMVGIQF